MEASAAIVIAAPAETVWAALVDPATLPRIMPVTEVLEPWSASGRFRWRFALGGSSREVSGAVLRLEPGRTIAYEYGDPLARGVLHRVDMTLMDHVGGTRLGVTQDGNTNEAMRAHAEGGWRLALANLKAVVEGKAPSSGTPIRVP